MVSGLTVFLASVLTTRNSEHLLANRNRDGRLSTMSTATVLLNDGRLVGTRVKRLFGVGCSLSKKGRPALEDGLEDLAVCVGEKFSPNKLAVVLLPLNGEVNGDNAPHPLLAPSMGMSLT